MADVITTYQGTIDEFMGDGILVLFGFLLYGKMMFNGRLLVR